MPCPGSRVLLPALGPPSSRFALPQVTILPWGDKPSYRGFVIVAVGSLTAFCIDLCLEFRGRQEFRIVALAHGSCCTGLSVASQARSGWTSDASSSILLLAVKDSLHRFHAADGFRRPRDAHRLQVYTAFTQLTAFVVQGMLIGFKTGRIRRHQSGRRFLLFFGVVFWRFLFRRGRDVSVSK